MNRKTVEILTLIPFVEKKLSIKILLDKGIFTDKWFVCANKNHVDNINYLFEVDKELGLTSNSSDLLDYAIKSSEAPCGWFSTNDMLEMVRRVK